MVLNPKKATVPNPNHVTQGVPNWGTCTSRAVFLKRFLFAYYLFLFYFTAYQMTQDYGFLLKSSTIYFTITPTNNKQYNLM